MKALSLLALMLMMLAQPLRAATPEDAAAKKVITQALHRLLPNETIKRITPSEIPGLYEVVLGNTIFLVTRDGRYLIKGTLYDLRDGRNLTQLKQAVLQADIINALDEDRMIIFGPKDAPYTITVFTDVDCPYCRLMHRQIDEYIKRGIRVRYLLYPRDVVGSPTYKKAVSVW